MRSILALLLLPFRVLLLICDLVIALWLALIGTAIIGIAAVFLFIAIRQLLSGFS